MSYRNDPEPANTDRQTTGLVVIVAKVDGRGSPSEPT
jgi:hypothetical protein